MKCFSISLLNYFMHDMFHQFQNIVTRNLVPNFLELSQGNVLSHVHVTDFYFHCHFNTMGNLVFPSAGFVFVDCFVLDLYGLCWRRVWWHLLSLRWLDYLPAPIFFLKNIRMLGDHLGHPGGGIGNELITTHYQNTGRFFVCSINLLPHES